MFIKLSPDAGIGDIDFLLINIVEDFNITFWNNIKTKSMNTLGLKFLAILMLVFGFIENVQGQISSSYERLFYTTAGNDAKSLRYCAKFENGKVWLKSVSYNEVRDKLAESSSYYDNEDWEDNGTESHYIWGQGSTKQYERCFKYCPSLSTSSRIVYKRHLEYSWTHPMEGSMNISGGFGCIDVQMLGVWGSGGKRFSYKYDMYIAFSPDKSSFIFWKEKANNLDGQIHDKQTFTRVPKSELLPKAVNYDFLNE